ncbi:hypothetical protein MMC24_002682 [Lignoscripta atroalba]|nr:hypothetical protein [Lignoscripta atroalba]
MAFSFGGPTPLPWAPSAEALTVNDITGRWYIVWRNETETDPGEIDHDSYGPRPCQNGPESSPIMDLSIDYSLEISSNKTPVRAEANSEQGNAAKINSKDLEEERKSQIGADDGEKESRDFNSFVASFKKPLVLAIKGQRRDGAVGLQSTLRYGAWKARTVSSGAYLPNGKLFLAIDTMNPAMEVDVGMDGSYGFTFIGEDTNGFPFLTAYFDLKSYHILPRSLNIIAKKEMPGQETVNLTEKERLALKGWRIKRHLLLATEVRIRSKLDKEKMPHAQRVSANLYEKEPKTKAGKEDEDEVEGEGEDEIKPLRRMAPSKKGVARKAPAKKVGVGKGSLVKGERDGDGDTLMEGVEKTEPLARGRPRREG